MKWMMFTCMICLGACAYAQSRNFDYHGSVKVLADRTSLRVLPRTVDLEDSLQAFAASALALLPPAIDLVSTGMETAARKDALRYRGEYRARATEGGFYPDEGLVNLPDLELTRQIIGAKSAKPRTAARIRLRAELSADKTAFRYKLTELEYLYSIAKTRNAFDYIEAALEIRFRTVTLNRGQYEIKDLRTTSLIIPMIEVGKTYILGEAGPLYSGWIPFPPKPTVEMELRKTEKESRVVVSSNTKNGQRLPADTSEQQTTTSRTVKELIRGESGSGLYEIEIAVVETNSYKFRAENRQKFMEGNSKSASALLKAAAKELLKEGEN